MDDPFPFSEQHDYIPSDQELAEQNWLLSSTLDFYQKILRNLNAVIYINDEVNFGLEWASDSFEHILGYNTEDLKELGYDGLRKLYHPDDFYIFRERLLFLSDPKNADKSHVAIYRIKHKNGKYIWLYFNSTALTRDESGYPLKVCGIMINMSDFVSRVSHFENFLKDKARESNEELLKKLTKKEKLFISDIAKGFSTKQIAYKHELSIRTIETHRRNVMKKLKFRNTALLVAFAHANGL